MNAMPAVITSSRMSLKQSPVRDVAVSSPFWAQMQFYVRDSTIPAIIKTQKSLGHWYCLTWKAGHEVRPHPFWDSDTYKVTEAACDFLMTQHNDTLRAEVEEAVDMICGAQRPDGYINSYYTVHGLS